MHQTHLYIRIFPSRHIIISSSPGFFSCIVPIPASRHRAAQHDHPGQEDGADDPEGEDGVPAAADAVLLEPGEGVDAQVGAGLHEDELLTAAVDVAGGAEQLDRRFDQACDVEDQQDEGADDDDAREQAALDDEDDHDPDEDDGQSANGDAEGHDPRKVLLAMGRMP